jgi:mannose-6-phosphate isomerase-like protein (cupin superfamily)
LNATGHFGIAAGMAANEPLGDVATRILFENDRVKVWEMLLEPGQASARHEHTLDYVLCIVEGASVDADTDDGASVRIPVEPGTVLYVGRGGIETAVNRSATRFREILIELKD